MRLSTPLSLCLAAAAALLPAPAAAGAESGPGPDCADGSRDFPLTTRIHGGPASYQAGGAPGTWYLDLTNTTDRPCTAVHPVVVLTDVGRALRPGQARMEFYDGPRAHPVRFETTDEAELVGAFDDGFPGFTVEPGRTVTVKVTLALTADTAPDQVTASAAVVRRRGDDGDWIGRSGDYRFGVDTEPASATDPRADPDADPEADPASVPTPSPTASRSPLALAEAAEQLARTGIGSAQRAALALAAALIAMGGALLQFRRRR